MKEKKKIDLDFTLIFFIKMLKKQKLIKTWEDGANIYYKITKKNISSNSLSTQAKKITIESVNSSQFLDYCSQTEKLVNKKNINDNNKINKKEDDVVIRTIGIDESDYDVFGIDIHKDSKATIRKKILRKTNDDIFLLEYLGFNPGTHEIKKRKIGAWTTPIKEKNGDTQIAIQILNEKFSIEIGKRKNPILYYTEKECKNFLEEFLKERKLTPLEIFDEKENTDKMLLNENLAIVSAAIELHIGKLGSVVDYEDYSTKQSMWRLKKVAKDLVKYQSEVKASTFILPVGGDYFNSDTTDDKTTAGTQQNNDTRFKETYLWGKIGFIEFIEAIKNNFKKVHLEHAPGNHDEKSSFSLFSNLYDIYTIKEDPIVDIEMAYKDIRFTSCQVFGENLLVFSHGKNPEGKPMSDKNLAQAVKNQFPEEYRKCKNTYVFAGHIHEDSENIFDNITVFRTASLSGIEAWTASNNYLNSRQGHSFYLIDKERGYLGKRNVTLTDSEKNSKIESINRNPSVSVPKAIKKVLNCNPQSIEIENNKEHIKNLELQKIKLKKEFIISLKSICEKLNTNFETLSEEEKDFLLSKIGYTKATENIDKELRLIKTYK